MKKMRIIELDENFTVGRDSYGWTLYEKHKRFSRKEKKVTYSTKRTYHPTLHLVLNRYLDQALKPASSVQEISEKLDKIEKNIKDFITFTKELNGPQ